MEAWYNAELLIGILVLLYHGSWWSVADFLGNDFDIIDLKGSAIEGDVSDIGFSIIAGSNWSVSD